MMPHIAMKLNLSLAKRMPIGVKCVAFISASSSSSSASEKKKRKKKKSALSSKEPQMSNATIAAGKAYDETDILYVDKLLMKAMAIPREITRA